MAICEMVAVRIEVYVLNLAGCQFDCVLNGTSFGVVS